MKNWEIIAAGLAILGGVWGHVQMFGRWLTGLVVAKCWTDRDVADVVSSYLVAHARHHAREPVYGTARRFVVPRGETIPVAYERLAVTARLMWRGRAPIWVAKPKEDHTSSYQYTFAFVRGTVNWSKLLLDAIEWSKGEFDDGGDKIRHHIVYHHGRTLGSEIAEQRRNNDEDTDKSRPLSWGRGNGKRLLHWDVKDLGSPPSAGFRNMSLTPELAKLVAEIRLFHDSRSWYEERGLTWRRGFLFHGLPGSGKTSLARATAEELDLPVHVFDLAGMSNEDLRDAWDKMLKDTPCMAVIEDIDAVFHGRKNVSPSGGMMASGGLTFDALLNCLDGIQQNAGVMVVVTTNHLEHVDPALVDRPGRIDRVVHFETLDHVGRAKIARRILGDGEAAERAALEHADLPAAKFVEACCRVAIAERFETTPLRTDPYR